MGLQTQINEDMLIAMKARETEKLSLLRVVSGEFSREMKTKKELSDEEALKVLRKMSENAKMLNNQNEIDILEKYLPKMLGENQIRIIIAGIILKQGFSQISEMGKVMTEIKKHPTAMLIDGKIASSVAKEILTQ